MKFFAKIIPVPVLLVLFILSCGGDDTDSIPGCDTPVWQLFTSNNTTTGNSSIDFSDERLNLSVENTFLSIFQESFTGDFSARLTFAELDLSEGGYFQLEINESYRDNNGNGVSFSGIAVSAISFGSSSVNRVMSRASIPPETALEFGTFNSQANNSGAIRISKKGNTLTVSTEIGFETIATSSDYQFTDGSTLGISITLGASPVVTGSSASVSLTSFNFEGNGAFNDDFACNRLIE